MNKSWLLLVAFIACGIAACSSDTAEAPADLVSFEPESQFNTAWKFDAGKGSGKRRLSLVPAIKYDTIFVADRDGRITALDKVSGKEKWQVDAGFEISAGVGVGLSNLVVSGINGELASFQQQNGDLIWVSQASSEVLAPAAIDSGFVVVRSVDGNLQAFVESTGDKVWSYRYVVPSLSLSGTSTPIVAHGGVISGTDNGRLSAIAIRTGNLLWETAVAVPTGASELSRMVDIDIPVVIDQDVIYAASYQGRVAMLSLASGRMGWAKKKSVHMPMAIDISNLYLADDLSHIWALNRRTGETVWVQDKLHARSVSGLTVIDDKVVVADFEGYIHALDTSDGRFVAREKLANAYTATPLVDNDMLYVYSRNGELRALTIQNENGATDKTDYN